MFQSFHLIPTLTALENVQVPLELRGEDRARARRRAARARGPRRPRPPLSRPALGRRAAARGARARVRATARSCCSPTSPPATSTPRTARNVIELLAELNRELGTTLVLVTHDPELAARAQRVMRLRDGARRWRDRAGRTRRVPVPASSLRMAWRESRAARTRLRLLTWRRSRWASPRWWPSTRSRDNLRASVREQARALLGADLVLGSAAPLSQRAESLLGDVRRSDAARRRGSRASPASARWPRPRGRPATRLAQVLAVEPGYPFYGTIATDAGRRVGAARARAAARSSTPSLLDHARRARRATRSPSARRASRSRGTIVSVPGRRRAAQRPSGRACSSRRARPRRPAC